MNPTLKKYNYPGSLVKDYCHWAVLIRPWQLTLGDMVIVEKSEATALGQLSGDSIMEFGQVCRDVEAVVGLSFRNDKINYVALMMADPNVHFHAIPRYASSREFEGAQFNDTGWPNSPDFTFTTPGNSNQLESLRTYLATHWPQKSQ